MNAHNVVLYYANDNELVGAIESADREAVLKRTLELFAETNAESFTVVDSSAIVLARGHNPDLSGDDTSYMSVVRSSLGGDFVLSAERGVSTNVSVRAATPIYGSSGQIIGALFAGERLDTNEFVDRLKLFTGFEISVFVDDIRVATTLHYGGERVTGAEVAGYVNAALLTGGEMTMLDSFRHYDIIGMHTPIYNYDGDIIGVITVGRFLTDKYDMILSFILSGLLITFIFLVINAVVVFLVSRGIAKPINEEIDKANYDILTGINNRRFFDENLNRVLQTLSRSNGTLSLIMLDIDFFKNYNDTYGHVEGDDCLRAVALVIKQAILRADDFAARYGGEEFAIVLPNTDESGALLVAQKLCESIRDCAIPHRKSDVSDFVTVSMGITTGDVKHTHSAGDFVSRADEMLYKSKQSGRNKYSFAPL
jgi:diguanylate cyclase (GGDEF)-like protein